MEVVILQVFVSLSLVVGSVLLFAFTHRQRSMDHVDRLALLPLEDDEAIRHGSAPDLKGGGRP